jgi:hypothetical protein
MALRDVSEKKILSDMTGDRSRDLPTSSATPGPPYIYITLNSSENERHFIKIESWREMLNVSTFYAQLTAQPAQQTITTTNYEAENRLFARMIPKAINTHSEYVTLIAFPLQR